MAFLATLGFSGCSTPLPENFSHEFHRERYRLTDEELKGLQFFVSSQVLAPTESPAEQNTPTGKNTILVKRGTPGVVTEVGPNWLRVSFMEGRPGVPFLANTGSDTDVYALYNLATTVEGSSGLKMVKDVPDHIAIYQGVRYKVAQGYNAILTCDTEQLQELINKRGIGPGRESPKK